MKRTTVGPVTKVSMVPVALIDPPDNAVRETMSEEGLLELLESIREVGLIYPLVLMRRGKRYEIAAGHRRYVACMMGNILEVPAFVRMPDETDGDSIKVHENYMREAVNPGEEAGFLLRLLESPLCGGDVDKLCARIKRPRSYVDSRFELLRGDVKILEALKSGQITFAAARALNRFKREDARRTYLEAAIQGGATAQTINGWRAHAEVLDEFIPERPADGTGGEGTPILVPPKLPECVVCGDGAMLGPLELLYVHQGVCNRVLQRWIDGSK